MPNQNTIAVGNSGVDRVLIRNKESTRSLTNRSSIGERCGSAIPRRTGTELRLIERYS